MGVEGQGQWLGVMRLTLVEARLSDEPLVSRFAARQVRAQGQGHKPLDLQQAFGCQAGLA